MDTQSPITLTQLLDLFPQGTPESVFMAVRRAYAYARDVLGDRQRETGEHLLEHDLAVAYIIAQLGLNAASILAALLHNTIGPASGKSEQELRNNFGSEVTALVTGLHNLYAYASEASYREKAQNADHRKLEEIRRAILTIIEGDIRIVLLRMAVVLQDLRKAGALPVDARLELATEAMQIYAPLANRLGVWQVKWQLEDLAFRHLQPEVYREIALQIDQKRITRATMVSDAVQQLDAHIKELGIKAAIVGRPKHIYSIYRKMERKGIDFEQIYDVQALRVVIDTTQLEVDPTKNRKQKDDLARSLCYQVLGAVHSLWQPIAHEFDDYIASPKPNGYRSLHTAVMDDKGNTLEVQIRTDLMDDEAERGIAAHWAYKEGEVRSSAAQNKRIHWFRQLLANLQDANESLSNGELLQQELLGERIFVFTPRGDVIDLPAGATPIDFAYHIHTQVGHRCRGAKVNGKMVSLDYVLQSGDKVEIITASRGGPNRDWMNESLGYAVSGRTRSRIRQWFRHQEREQNIAHGKQVVERELKRLALTDTFSIADIASALRYSDVDDFLANVGFGDIQVSQIGGAIASLQQKLRPDDELRPLLDPPRKPTRGLTVQGVSGLHTKVAGCCSPIPPQPIVGYVTRGSGVTIHRAGCPTLDQITERDRLIDVEWGMDQDTYPVPIVVRAYHRPGLVEEISNILRGRRISVPKTKKTTSDSITTIYMVAEISNIADLNWLMQRIEKLPNVLSVQRQKWAD